MTRAESSAPIEDFHNPADVLNVAAVCAPTRALGPGLRAVVWVQGCAFHCPGCIAPEWVPMRPVRLVSPETLVTELLADATITGLTLSGGEPMLQAAGLARLARAARAQRDLNIICFSGYQRSVLESNPPVPGVKDLLDQVDVLIDGPYIHRLNDNRGLRGSRNQRVHYLTDRLRQYDLETQPRRVELRVQPGQVLMVGVPPLKFGETFNRAMDQVNHRVNISAPVRLDYERP